MGTRSAKIKNLSYLVLLIILVVSTHAFAKEWVESYTNTRSLGMGGALIGLTSDETSLYRNPANLGSIRGYFGVLVDPEIEGQEYFTDKINAGNLTGFTDVKSMASTVKNKPHENYHGRLQLTPNFSIRNFSLGFIYRKELNLISDSSGQLADAFHQDDFGLALGLNHSFFGGVLKIGATVRAFNRIEVASGTLDLSGDLSLKSIATEGSALAYDAGIILQAPVQMLPSLSVVVRDIGNTVFDKKDGARLRVDARPEEVKQSVDAAISLFPIHANQVRSLWTLEYRDVTNSRDESGTVKRLHFGTEINLKDLFFIRLGLNQGYYTAGFELASEHVAWQVATYGEEIGTESQKKEDRRYSTKIILRY